MWGVWWDVRACGTWSGPAWPGHLSLTCRGPAPILLGWLAPSQPTLVSWFLPGLNEMAGPPSASLSNPRTHSHSHRCSGRGWCALAPRIDGHPPPQPQCRCLGFYGVSGGEPWRGVRGCGQDALTLQA